MSVRENEGQIKGGKWGTPMRKKKKLSNSDRYIEGGVRIIAWFIFPIIFFFSKIILSFDSLVVRLRSTVTPPAPWSNNKAHTQVCIMRNMRYSSAQELNQAINRRAPKWLENAFLSFRLIVVVVAVVVVLVTNSFRISSSRPAPSPRIFIQCGWRQ